MSEDEIQYIGTKPAAGADIIPDHAFQAHSFLLMRRPVTGFIMHVREADDMPGRTLTFLKSRTNVVNIGRRPGSENELKDDEPVNAMFRCPVISRRHARVTFTDGGYAYIVDLNSHHGTHILKQGHTVSKMLEPQEPTQLTDGDILTFGKSVGKDELLVRPVTVRIELLFTAGNSPTLPAKSFPYLLPDTSSNSVPDGTDSMSRSISGRYGLHYSSSISDDSSSSSEQGSDSEEMPQSSSAPSSNIAKSHCFGLPPIDTFGHQEQFLPSPGWLLKAHDTGLYPFEYPTSVTTPISPAVMSVGHLVRDGVDVLDSSLSRKRGPSSRYSSPMELSSPSPRPTPLPAPEPLIIGAWPVSRPSSPIVIDHEAEERGDSDNAADPHEVDSDDRIQREAASQADDSLSPASNEAVKWISRAPSEVVCIDVEEHDDDAQDVIHLSSLCATGTPTKSAPAASRESLSVDRVEQSELKIASIESRLDKIQHDFSKLHSQQRKYKSILSSRFSIFSERFENADERITEINSLYSSLADQLQDLSGELTGVHDQANDLEDRVGTFAFMPVPQSNVKSALSGRDDINASVSALNDLVAEVKAFRTYAELQMSAEIETIKAARADALGSVTAETSTSQSLKRKRSLSEHDEPLVIEEGLHTQSSITEIPASSRKRARTLLSTLAQTAAAVTFGAVATWSALAFS